MSFKKKCIYCKGSVAHGWFREYSGVITSIGRETNTILMGVSVDNANESVKSPLFI